MTKIERRARVRRMLDALYGNRHLTYNEGELATVVSFDQRVLSKASAAQHVSLRWTAVAAKGKPSSGDPVEAYRAIRQSEDYYAKRFVAAIDYWNSVIANAKEGLVSQQEQLDRGTAKVAAAWEALTREQQLAFSDPHPHPQSTLDYPVYVSWELHHFPDERTAEQERQVRELELALAILDSEIGNGEDGQ